MTASFMEVFMSHIGSICNILFLLSRRPLQSNFPCLYSRRAESGRFLDFDQFLHARNPERFSIRQATPELLGDKWNSSLLFYFIYFLSSGKEVRIFSDFKLSPFLPFLYKGRLQPNPIGMSFLLPRKFQ